MPVGIERGDEEGGRHNAGGITQHASHVRSVPEASRQRAPRENDAEAGGERHQVGTGQ
jgi:hypothetical protein